MKNKLGFIITMIVVMLIGVALIVFGVVSSVRLNEETKDYVSVEAVFCDYSEYSSGEDGTTYSLEYEYIVDGEKYYVSTDYGTGIIPKEGSIKTIKYNPDNPSEAIITGFGSNALVFVVGFMFVGVPIIFLMTIREKKKKKESIEKIRFKSTITSVLIGLVFAGTGAGFYYLMCNGSDDLSLISAFETVGLLILVPIFIMILGIYTIFSSLFLPKKKEVILNIDDIVECEDETYNILLSDISIDVESLKSIMYKYYIYNTKNKEKFEINKKYKVDIYKYGVMHEVMPVSPMIQARSLDKFKDEDFEKQS